MALAVAQGFEKRTKRARSNGEAPSLRTKILNKEAFLFVRLKTLGF